MRSTYTLNWKFKTPMLHGLLKLKRVVVNHKCIVCVWVHAWSRMRRHGKFVGSWSFHWVCNESSETSIPLVVGQEFLVCSWRDSTQSPNKSNTPTNEMVRTAIRVQSMMTLVYFENELGDPPEVLQWESSKDSLTLPCLVNCSFTSVYVYTYHAVTFYCFRFYF